MSNVHFPVLPKNIMAPVLSQPFPPTMIIVCHSYTMIHLNIKKGITKERKISLWESTLVLTQREQICIVDYNRLSGVGLRLLSIRWAEKKVHECKHIKFISDCETVKCNINDLAFGYSIFFLTKNNFIFCFRQM